MKKAQILSALALAFALGLGVIAPVANTYAETYTGIEVRETKEATGTEVQAALNYVNANATYRKIANLEKTIAEYGSARLHSTTAATIQSRMSNLNDKDVNGVNSDNGKIVATYNNNDTLEEMVGKAVAVTNYDLYADFIKDFNATKFDIDTVRSDVVKMINAGIVSGVSVANWSTNGAVNDGDGVKRALTGSADFDKIANYDLYSALITSVNYVKDYSEAYDEIHSALAAAMNENGVKALENLDSAKPKYTASIGDLKGLAVNANITRYNEWQGVYNAINPVTPYDYTTAASTANYNYVKGIADQWIIALPDYENAADVVAEVMMGYKGGSNPSEGTGEGSNNGNDGEGEGDAAGDTDKTPEAGDTGVIAAADGTASSTVAIVAGIATALTAAGAGVVAYRNARRQEA